VPEVVPVPLTLIHACVVDAAQVQPVAVATSMLPVPPVAVNDALAGVST
jgi:hypothetical protein